HSTRTPERRVARLAAALTAVSLIVAGCTRSAPDTEGVIRVSGNIEVTDAQISFKIPGRMIERTVDEGDSVEKGKLIARLDDAELTQEVALRKAELAAAQAALAELEAGSRPQELTAAEAAVNSAQAERNRAKLDFTRQRELRASDAVSEREFEAAQAALEVAEARVVEATERLALLREGPRKETIAQANARSAQAEAAVTLAETRLANTRLESPLTGVVLEKNAEPGEFVGAGAPIVTVADTAQVWLRAYVNQTDLGRIRLGQSVDVRTDTYPDKTYAGRLTYISSEAEFTPKTVQTEKERVTLVFRVKIQLDNSSGELKPGMAADAYLEPTAEGE
ncbi:MAG: efflux RND transporter periplasmic adaptor subunit, partial [Verrucomicrobiae bacterium]|nr:efflux RND transporter periplasmic adaptor subunit [Verrucomicrobiae bacterium]